MTVQRPPGRSGGGEAGDEPPGYRLFREAMANGRLAPGMTLTQGELCRILGMSLTPVREMLVLLRAYGLVEVRPRSGVHIVYPDIAFIRENFQFRIMIETTALKLLAQTDISGWLGEMTSVHDRDARALGREGNIDAAIRAFIETDRRFHADIVATLDNRAISATHQRLQDNIGMARKAHQRAVFRQHLLDTVDEHRRVLDALGQRDLAAATEALEAHFRASTHRTFAA